MNHLSLTERIVKIKRRDATAAVALSLAVAFFVVSSSLVMTPAYAKKQQKLGIALVLLVQD
jgi:hypothetical protein